MATIPKTVSLTHKNEAWINERIRSGDFGNASEYIRDLIRRDEERQTRIDVIRAALIEGEQSGISGRTPEEIMAAVIESKRRNGEL
ncbi:MAG: type II toxin-antitoxin system ParD family antitoxin [Deltaproteobacteria bacterium]|nr:type II toxin-antitoxin system ParD family antitoxin [Deltaproteobacteria bacterium]